MKKVYHLALLVAFVLVVFGTHAEVFALSCVPSTVEQKIEQADAIFAGKVVTVETGTSEKAASATFEVSEYWKGTVSTTMTVGGIYTWNGTANPPVYFKVGKTYLVFAYNDSKSSFGENIPGRLVASIDCGLTALLSDSGNVKATLGPGKVVAQTEAEEPIASPTDVQTEEPVAEPQPSNPSFISMLLEWLQSLFK